jgi:hypothetical protein
MIANYGEPKGKAASVTTGITKQLEGHPAEPKAKKLWVQSSDPKEAAVEEAKTSATYGPAASHALEANSETWNYSSASDATFVSIQEQS